MRDLTLRPYLGMGEIVFKKVLHISRKHPPIAFVAWKKISPAAIDTCHLEPARRKYNISLRKWKLRYVVLSCQINLSNYESVSPPTLFGVSDI